MGIDLAPAFDIAVNGIDLDPNIARLVSRVEWDAMDSNGADQMKLQLLNPEFVLTDKKLFRVGNIVKLWAGYGGSRTFIGGARIEKARPEFPSGGAMPTIELIAYTGDKIMMNNAPKPRAFGAPFSASPPSVRGAEGRTWDKGLMYSDAIRDKARFYGFFADVDDTPAHIIGPMGVFQKAGMTDFEFVGAIANELGWMFWVSADEFTETWTLHFKDPDTTVGIQDTKYEFAYDRGDQSTMESFSAEELLSNGPTSMKVQFLNPKTKKLETISVDVDPTFIADSPEYLGVPEEEPLLRPPNNPESGPEIILAFGGISDIVRADRQFGSIAEAETWAKAWYAEHLRDFIRGEFAVRGPGSETITPRQVHALSGLRSRYSGDYYLTHVGQSWSAGGGHSVSANGSKITNKIN